ncbi:MAG: hypothetical protein M1337_07520 [Actinobacteria bacterium]|nr:hypothetical protein [Actinomycetota bacterium]
MILNAKNTPPPGGPRRSPSRGAQPSVVVRSLGDFRVANEIIHVEDGQAVLDAFGFYRLAWNQFPTEREASMTDAPCASY